METNCWTEPTRIANQMKAVKALHESGMRADAAAIVSRETKAARQNGNHAIANMWRALIR